MPNRRGAAYLITLGITLLVSVLGLAGLKIVRLTRAQQSQVTDMGDARMIARAALDMSLLRMETDPDWRSKMEAGTWGTDQVLGSGTYSIEAVDPNDGDLTDSETDPVVIVGIGKSGSAVQKLQMQVNFDAVGMSCLRSSIHADARVNFTSDNAALTADQVISANIDVIARDGLIQGDVEAVGTVTGTNIQGTVTTGIEPREVPDESSVFDFYLANGTWIPHTSIPWSSSDEKHVIENTVLTPTYNPFSGGTNALGIYIIDCHSDDIYVINSRIQGTLVLMDVGTNDFATVEQNVNWQPAVSNYPSLLVDGRIKLEFDSVAALDEAALGVNFNPAGAPYAGETDASTDDVYPSLIKGLIYATDRIRLDSGSPKLQGVLVSGFGVRPSNSSNTQVIYDSNFYYNPPPGFQSTPKPTVVSGSFRRVVDP